MHLSYILIPLVTILVAFAGGQLTMRSVKTWYKTIRKPTWTPPGAVIGAVWTVLYILAALSALIVWNLPLAPVSAMVTMLFILNAAVNVLWSYVFFYLHNMAPAIWVCLFLDSHDHSPYPIYRAGVRARRMAFGALCRLGDLCIVFKLSRVDDESVEKSRPF